MNSIAITTINASEELRKAQKFLRAYGKANAAAKKKLGGEAYKKAVDERIDACQQVIDQSTVNPNASTLPGSPNDPIQPGQLNQVQEANPRSGADNGGQQSKDPNIDPTLVDSEAPPTKRPRIESDQRHRKIVVDNPLESVKESINAPMLARFLALWFAHGSAVEAADPDHTANKFDDLCDSATEIIDHVTDVAQRAEYSNDQFKWEIEYDGGPVKFSHLIALHNWLVDTGLMVGSIQQKPAPKKGMMFYSSLMPEVNSFPVTNERTRVKIHHDGKYIAMTQAMLTQARLEPAAYPGCVEAGIETVSEVLTNRNGRSKCISCDASGLRGKALDDRPIPPPADHPYPNDCKCPLRGAALELWITKMTAGKDGIPQRGDGNISNHRLALNPDILKVIAEAIEVVSGHEVETLLEPEITRLQKTVVWALGRLHKLAEEEDSQCTASFPLLLTKFKETMTHWMLEDSDDDSD
ncbi:hypothetical protein MVEN_02575600 [Mycena venus]|uniref:Uncharacterized protein n=1 Tax=Mycena venus TaxID=2733690 RepID=A0A8H6U4V7_9AGAR|nr:hypothetical protein MVEN_02575600 [Mycena venus]